MLSDSSFETVDNRRIKILGVLVSVLLVGALVAVVANQKSATSVNEVGHLEKVAAPLELSQDTLPLEVEQDGGKYVVRGRYLIAAMSSGRVFDVYGARKTRGTKVIQYQIHCGNNQKFQLIPVDPKCKKGEVYVKNINSGLYLDIYGAKKGARARLIQWTLHGGGNQRFRFIKQKNGSVKIVVVHSKLVLDVYGNSKKNLAQIIQYPSHNGANQRFLLLPA